MPYLTPDTMPATFVCRRLRIPDGIEWLEIVNGALTTLLNQRIFEQHGLITPVETAEVFLEMFLEYLEGEVCLLGSILPYANATPPTGTLACDGQSYARTDYPALYGVLSSVYITDADTFVTPDLRGRAVIGTGVGTDLTARITGDAGGVEVHTLTVDELAIHDHLTTDHTHTDAGHTHTTFYPTLNIDIEGAGIPDLLGAGNPPVPTTTGIGYASIQPSNVEVHTTGDDQPHQNMPPFHALNYCIVAR